MTIETTIEGDLRVIASCEVHEGRVEDLEITLLNGKPFPGELSDEDEQRIVDLLVEAYNEPPC